MKKKFMRFPGGKTKVVTLSYDDSQEADERLIQLMEQYGMKGTFNLIPGWFAEEGTTYPEGESYRCVSESKAVKIYDSPAVEVANHGNTHKYMSSLTTAEMAEDILTCRKTLESLYQRNIRGMAYPYGWYSGELEDVLAMCSITYSRTVNTTHSFELPRKWLEWHPTCHHDDEKMLELANKFVEMKVNENPKIYYIWGHTFEFERENNWDRIEEFMKVVSGKEDTWYATNEEIYDYVEAYRSLIISVDGKRIVNPTKIPVWVEVDDVLYEIKDELVL